MSTFKTITSVEEVRKLAAAGLLWWCMVEPAAVAWSTYPDVKYAPWQFYILLED